MNVLETANVDAANFVTKTLIVTVINTCDGISLINDSLPIVNYLAGDPEITIDIADFDINPSTANCPGIQHSYSYSMMIGSIDPSWIILDQNSLTPNVKFAAPTDVAGVPVPAAVVEVYIDQYI